MGLHQSTTPTRAHNRPRRVHSEADHAFQLARAQAELTSLRQRLQLPSQWTVHLRIVCPEEMPECYGRITWEYLPYQQFLIELHCSLDEEGLRWTLAHELLEARTAPMAEFTWDLLVRNRASKAINGYLDKRHRLIRDETIEHLLPAILGMSRPLSLTGWSAGRPAVSSMPPLLASREEREERIVDEGEEEV